MCQWPLCCQTLKRLVVDPAAQHCCAGWICGPEKDGFSSNRNANADIQGN